MPSHRLPHILLVLVLVAQAAGATNDELAKEIARREAEVAKAQQVFDTAVSEADAKALKAFVRVAQRSKEPEAAKAAWSEVLRLERKHPEALAWLGKHGSLEAVLEELDHPTDLLGNPLPGAGARVRPGRAVLLIGAGSSLVPVGVRTLTEAFTARTTELVVGAVAGDGVLFEEGASGNGQAIGVVGSEVHYVVRAGGMLMGIKAPFDRGVAWTQIVVQFDGGALRLWLNGKLVAKSDSGFPSIPGHGGGGIARGDGSNCGGWGDNCTFTLAALRLSGRARYGDQQAPDGTMDSDGDTLLALTPEAIAAQLAAQSPAGRKASEAVMLQRVEGMPPANIAWAITGSVGVK